MSQRAYRLSNCGIFWRNILSQLSDLQITRSVMGGKALSWHRGIYEVMLSVERPIYCVDRYEKQLAHRAVRCAACARVCSTCGATQIHRDICDKRTLHGDQAKIQCFACDTTSCFHCGALWDNVHQQLSADDICQLTKNRSRHLKFTFNSELDVQRKSNVAEFENMRTVLGNKEGSSLLPMADRDNRTSTSNRPDETQELFQDDPSEYEHIYSDSNPNGPAAQCLGNVMFFDNDGWKQKIHISFDVAIQSSYEKEG